MKNSNGFTVIEIIMVILVIGILASVAVVKFRDNLVRQELDQAANNLYLELRGLRTLSFKHDALVVAKFSTGSSTQCEIYVDKNDNAAKDDGEVVQVLTLPKAVALGLSEQAPGTMPYESGANEDWSPPSGGLAVDWEDSITVVPDSRGDYNHGGVCLNSTEVKNVTYFIGITSSIQSIEFYMWEGTSWRKL